MTGPAPDPEFETLLTYLSDNRGYDFSNYKRPTLMRRVEKRVGELRLTSFSEYVDYLEVHVEEFQTLFDTILINVTSFFRDPKAWTYFGENIVTAIVDAVGDGEPIRIWSAGCASGEEAYTLAMAFAEYMGFEAFRQRVKIYATDIDEDALATARSGLYGRKALEGMPEALRDRYFEGSGDRRSFRTDLRRSLIFGRHDISRDAPISRLDLVACRNTLMYFNAEAQAGIVQRLHYSLRPAGYLFLGRAETLLSFGTLFKPDNAPYRIFSKIPRPPAASRAVDLLSRQPFTTPNDTLDDRGESIAALVFQTMQEPAIVVDRDGLLVGINDAARDEFGLAPIDVGRLFQDLELSYRPIDLRTPIDRAISTGQVIDLTAVEGRPGDKPTRYYDISVTPLGNHRQPAYGAAIVFTDITRLRGLQNELKRTTEDLETAYEELQSSNEELETTNEELQSTVEELETTNEELQSTNEELETTNEELRSTNEELEAINEELRIRTREAGDANAYLTSIVNDLSVGVIVIDATLSVRTWNAVAQDTWGLRMDEVLDRSFFELDSGLPADELRDSVAACLTGSEQVDDVVIEAVNRRGRSIRCLVKVSPLLGADRLGVVLLFDELKMET